MENKNNFCAFCGNYTAGFELCSVCYKESKEGLIIKTTNGNWIKKEDQYKFYNENKKYYLKPEILNEWELKFYNIVSSALNKNYTIIPQINLQSIINTSGLNRNDELFRNIDFGIFIKETYSPVLMIELNGEQHNTNGYYKERDISVSKILEKVKLPLLNISIKDIKLMTSKNIKTIIKYTLNYIKNNKYENINFDFIYKHIKKLGTQT